MRAMLPFCHLYNRGNSSKLSCNPRTDVIDMVTDELTGNDYKKEEDPRHYVSKKNGRGPLLDDWISRPPEGVIMCSYKLIKVRA